MQFRECFDRHKNNSFYLFQIRPNTTQLHRWWQRRMLSRKLWISLKVLVIVAKTVRRKKIRNNNEHCLLVLLMILFSGRSVVIISLQYDLHIYVFIFEVFYAWFCSCAYFMCETGRTYLTVVISPVPLSDTHGFLATLWPNCYPFFH
jgi:hypothetical protein